MEGQEGAFDNSSGDFYPTEKESYLIVLQITVAITCILSIAGSSLIILTYFCFKDIRTLARHILVCLSIADFIVATANLIGLLFYYKRFVPAHGERGHENHTANSTHNHIPAHWCEVQAAFTVYGTQSSILWTIAVAAYMFVLIVLPKKRHWGNRLLLFFHVVCWGVPFILTLWLGIDGFLGFEHSATPGFCAIKGTIRAEGLNGTTTHYQAIYPIILGYEVWLYIAFILLPIFCVITTCHAKSSKKSQSNSNRKFPDKKLILVAVLFMFLRVWSIIVDVSVYYLPEEAATNYRHSYASAVFGILEGIGDSGQGAANGVLFCLFTRTVRKRLFASAVKCTKCFTSCKLKKTSDVYDVQVNTREDRSDHQLIDAANSIVDDGNKSDQKLLLNVGSDNFNGYSSTSNQ